MLNNWSLIFFIYEKKNIFVNLFTLNTGGSLGFKEHFLKYLIESNSNDNYFILEKSHSYIISAVETIKIREWIETDWIIFKVLIVLYIILSVNNSLQESDEESVPLNSLGNVFFFYYICQIRNFEYKNSIIF